MENNGKLQHLFIPSKSATLVPDFAMEDLLLSRNVALVPEFTVKVNLYRLYIKILNYRLYWVVVKLGLSP